MSALALFSTPAEVDVREVMVTDPISVTDDTDQEIVGQLFREHGLFAVPVVDNVGRMKGVVTVDDIVGVLERRCPSLCVLPSWTLPVRRRPSSRHWWT